jgi:hypothetical protein
MQLSEVQLELFKVSVFLALLSNCLVPFLVLLPQTFEILGTRDNICYGEGCVLEVGEQSMINLQADSGLPDTAVILGPVCPDTAVILGTHDAQTGDWQIVRT